MATETGVIKAVLSSTTGYIDRDPVNASPDPVQYNDPTLDDRKITLVAGEKVSYSIDLDAVVTNVTPLVVSDPEPADEGTIKTGALTGFSVAAGQIITIKSGTVTGDINMLGGKLIIKTGSVVKGSIDARQDAELSIYNSSIEKSLLFRNSNKSVIVHNGSVGGDTDIRNSFKVIKNGSVGGDTDIRNNLTVNIDGLTLTGESKNLDIRNNSTSTTVKNVVVNNGDVTIKNNTGCSYSSIVAPNGTVDIDGCN